MNGLSLICSCEIIFNGKMFVWFQQLKIVSCVTSCQAFEINLTARHPVTLWVLIICDDNALAEIMGLYKFLYLDLNDRMMPASQG